MTPLEIASFSKGGTGGNPAGVVIADALPPNETMQKVAADLGFSETAFAAPDAGGWRVRYFAPIGEVAFCGHATIALGAALGQRFGAGRFDLALRDGDISVEASERGGEWHAALKSPATWSNPMDQELCDQLLELFGVSRADLDSAVPPTLAFAGVRHGLLTLKDRAALAAMQYPFEAMRDLMAQHDLTTVSLLHVEGPRSFSSRNAFASGGVVEDPATGAAAAALGGALVDLNWDGLRKGGSFVIAQGEDMGMPSALTVEVSGTPGASVKVSGAVRWM
ncbi:Phenazine biosynthesis protein, PhzF family [Sulfitobacter noctilucicola]|uniref:PhzF family phenazine biosynthesis protein n=1 Tax=Sulfitobacter noctilucicola TaxID=1342301 RepID=A0A7W6M5V7_9RHOB|nr:PhzF family phenazine biosynthesis isomerase [Sulfitobacter noctilucicola]KIN62521.1 Phenazine biosynthesis protein, PhzF family [Sulfitobacter noctilucicola]MBB4172949.1 PhzF family phenazine biosynthesis protein [Sulfitobacter noctilucicola]